MPSTPERRTAFARARRILVDPRLLIGVVLVVASVAGMVGIVLATDRTREVLVARVALVPGDVVRVGDLDVVGVGLGSLAERYLAPEEVPADGVVVTRAVVAGEAVPRSAVGEARGARFATIVVEAHGLLPSAVTPGSTVDLWAAPVASNSSADAGDGAAPTVLVDEAIVVRLIEDDALVATGDVTGVELLVPRSRIARVLAARAADTELAVVPAGIPLAP
jgi:hypothetical protein